MTRGYKFAHAFIHIDDFLNLVHVQFSVGTSLRFSCVDQPNAFENALRLGYTVTIDREETESRYMFERTLAAMMVAHIIWNIPSPSLLDKARIQTGNHPEIAITEKVLVDGLLTYMNTGIVTENVEVHKDNLPLWRDRLRAIEINGH